MLPYARHVLSLRRMAKRPSLATNGIVWMLCLPQTLFESPLNAEIPWLAAAPATAEAAHFARIEHAPRREGRLDDPVWEQATSLTRRYEIYPADTAIPRVKTEARFLFDNHDLYVWSVRGVRLRWHPRASYRPSRPDGSPTAVGGTSSRWRQSIAPSRRCPATDRVYLLRPG